MKKLINDPKNVVGEMLKGVVQTYPYLEKLHGINSIVFKNNNRSVVLLSGGGSGHEPLDIGYVGDGLLDGAILGDPFIPPTYKQIEETVNFFGNDRPIIFIVKNFKEDLEQFTKAQKKLVDDGYKIEILIVDDDSSINPETKEPRKRGVAGTVLIHKILSSAADKGLSVDELLELGKLVDRNLYTMGVALTGSELPGEDTPSFLLDEDEIFYGVGIHGEPGYRKEKLLSSELLGRELVNKLVKISQVNQDDDVLIMINGLGNIPMMERFIFTNDVNKLFKLRSIYPKKVMSGNFLTSYNMSGISITLLKLQAASWLNYLNSPCEGFGWN